METKINRSTANNDSKIVFKTRLDAVCYSQAKIIKALKDMQKALDAINGPLHKDECRFKLFISLADAKEDFPKAKRFVIFVDPNGEQANLTEIQKAAAYVRKHQLGRIKIRNDFGHEVILTAYTAYKLDETHQLLRVLNYILIDELDKADRIIDLIVGGITQPSSNHSFNPDLGWINLIWTRN